MKVRFAFMIGIPLTTTLLLASCAVEDQSRPATLPSHAPFVTGVSTSAPTMTSAPLSPTQTPTLIPTPPPAATPIMTQGLSPTPTLIPTSPPAATLAPGQSPSPTTTLPPAAATFLAELDQQPTRTIQVPPSPTPDLRPTVTPYPTVSLDKPWLRFDHSDVGFTFEYPEGSFINHEGDVSVYVTMITSDSELRVMLILKEINPSPQWSAKEIYENTRKEESNKEVYETAPEFRDFRNVMRESEASLRQKWFHDVEGIWTVDSNYVVLATKNQTIYRFALIHPSVADAKTAKIFQRVLQSVEVKK